MQLFYNTFGFVLLVVLIIMMSMMVRWGNEPNTEKRKKWSDAWHLWSVYFRTGALVLFVVTNFGDWHKLFLLFGWFLIFCYPLWDGIIAWHLHRDFLFIGNTAKWDKIWNRTTATILKAILFSLTVIYSIIYSIFF